MNVSSYFMRQALRRPLFAFLFIYTLGLVLSANSVQFKADLNRALKQVDRLVITPPFFTEPNIDPETPLFEIKGHDKVMSLVALMEFKDESQQNCECDGTHRFQFFDGPNYRFAFSYHHYVALRGEAGAPWLSNAILTEGSRDAVINWLAREGFSDVKKLWDQNTADNSRDKKYVDDIASLFPPEAHDWFPQRGSRSPWRERDRSKDLAKLFPDKPELILTCWQAFGKSAKWEPHESALLLGEPFSFLFEALKEITADDFASAIRKLTPNDKTAWLGAFRHLCLMTIHEKHLLSSLTPDWPVHLARYDFENGPEFDCQNIIETLERLKTAEADEFLLEIAGKDLSANSDSRSGNTAIDVLYRLALRKHPAAQPIIERNLKLDLSDNQRLKLELSNALYQENTALTAEHLVLGYDFDFASDGISHVVTRLLKTQMGREEYLQFLKTATRSSNQSIAKKAGARLKDENGSVLDEQQLAIHELGQPNKKGRELVAHCTELLGNEKNESKRAVLLDWRGQAYLDLGEYNLAYEDLRKSPFSYSLHRLLATFAVGRLGEVVNNHWLVSSRKPDQLKTEGQRIFTYTLYLIDNLFDDDETENGPPPKPTESFEQSLLMFLAQKKHGKTNPEIFSAIDLSRPFQKELVSHLKEKLCESKLLAMAKTTEDKLLANWVLAEIALINGKPKKAKQHLETCLAVNAYTDPNFIMARLRYLRLADYN